MSSVLDHQTLILNRFFQAIQVTTVKRAMSLLYSGRVRAVAADYTTYDFDNWCDIPAQPEDELVHTPGAAIVVPRVVQLLRFDKVPRQEVRFSRANIYTRDKNRCQYCGKRFSSAELSLDHVVPTSRGGKSSWENVVCACLKCNVKKGNRLPSECGMELRKRPARPKWHPLHRFEGKRFPEVWKNFLDVAYWNVPLAEE